MRIRSSFTLALILSSVAMSAFAEADDKPPESPRSVDDRLVVELFAEHPQIVTPTGITVDKEGRVFVAESHTHFRPDDYDGPEKDRIVILYQREGKASLKVVFHEGFTWLMDIEFFRDGSLYAATRSDIYRLRDTDGDDKADEVTTIVHLETTGTYPHNGLSGLAFDFDGNLNFGLGENLGHDYTLVGSDGVRISGGGEGGSTYRVKADGTGLVRTSTGWWNPWGMCVDEFGRVFGTDNDPGESPPCRLIQVFDGADYGYEYRYGRSGLHPLVSWTGDMPGTLPMISGTGEAPCAVVAYDSNDFPEEYRGRLLAASWADHRIDQFVLKQENGKGLVSAERKPLVVGEGDFRPVGLAIDPTNGWVYFTDWVSSSYTIHKQGRVWRIRNVEVDVFSTSPDKRQRLWQRYDEEMTSYRSNARGTILSSYGWPRRAAALQGLIKIHDKEADFQKVAKQDEEVALRVLAVRELIDNRDADPAVWLADDLPLAVQAEAVQRARIDDHYLAKRLVAALKSDDPLMFHAAVTALARQASDQPEALAKIEHEAPLGVLLALKRNPNTRARAAEEKLSGWLASDDPRVRFAAVKWIADDKLAKFRPQLEALLDDPRLDLKLYLATIAALDRLDGKPPRDRPGPERLIATITNDNASPTLRRMALRLIDPALAGLKVDQLEPLLSHADEKLRLEAVRTLAGNSNPARLPLLEAVARNEKQPVSIRAAAVAGLAGATEKASLDLLVDLTLGKSRTLRNEALRSLAGVELTRVHRARLHQVKADDIQTREALARVLGKPLVKRPTATDTVSWLAVLPEHGDPEAGERIFFGQKLGTCARCHEVQGRGNAVGPSLTLISRRLSEVRNTSESSAAPHDDAGRRWLLETILQPSRELAPQYTTWQIVTTDGKLLTGLPRRKGGSQEAYLGVDGKEFTVKKSDIEISRELDQSIMPDDLLKTLTPQEIADLLAYLMQPR